MTQKLKQKKTPKQNMQTLLREAAAGIDSILCGAALTQAHCYFGVIVLFTLVDVDPDATPGLSGRNNKRCVGKDAAVQSWQHL